MDMDEDEDEMRDEDGDDGVMESMEKMDTAKEGNGPGA